MRFAAHDEHERLTATQRWRGFAGDRASKRFTDLILCGRGAGTHERDREAGCAVEHDEM